MFILIPDKIAKNAYMINYDRLYDEGFRGIIFDIDNTLVGHDAPADGEAKALADRLKSKGFSICIVSNNEEPRVKLFAGALDLPYVYKAGKPLTKGYVEAMRIMGTQKENTLSIGDQVFTDVAGSRRAGVYTIMTRRLYFKEPPHIHLKRIFEAPFRLISMIICR